MIVVSDKLVTNPVVMVYVVTYNHQEYISEALESVYNQKTSFDYIVVVCDDCSNDDTRTIIRNKYSQHEEKTILILNDENMYGKGVYNNHIKNIGKMPRCKYLSILEGDDFFSDENKLQSQFDLMESNLELSAVVQRAWLLNCDSGEKSIIPGNKYGWGEGTINTDELIYSSIMDGNIFPLNTFFGRTEYIYDLNVDNCFWNCYAGDLAYILYWAIKGKIYYDKSVTATKRLYNKGSLSNMNKKSAVVNQDIKRRTTENILQLETFDEITAFKYQDIIKNKINLLSVLDDNRWKRGQYIGYRGLTFDNKLVGIIITQFLKMLRRIHINVWVITCLEEKMLKKYRCYIDK